MTDVYETAARYGVRYSGELVDHTYHAGVNHEKVYTLADVAAANGKISRLRILAGNMGGRWIGDISYIHATLPNGDIVSVGNTLGQIRNMKGITGELINWAKSEHVYAKGVNLLDSNVRSILWGP